MKYDNALFVWLDSNNQTGEQDLFLQVTLQRAAQDPDVQWRFVFFHYPPIPCGLMDDWEKGKQWHDDFFLPHGVDVVFSGHAPYYERTCPFVSANAKTCDESNRGNHIGDSPGVLHVITGGGSMTFDETGLANQTENCGWLETRAYEPHFVEIEVNGNKLSLKTWDTANGPGQGPVLIDDFSILKPITCVDIDNDGYGDPENETCTFPERDCDDTDRAIYPGAVEVCDLIDNNCDHLVDDADPEIVGQGIWYADADSDQYGDPIVSISACNHPAGYVSDNTDCDDGNAAVHPDAMDVCDAMDNDCDAGTVDGSGENWNGASCDGPDTDLCQEGISACINGARNCSDVSGDNVEVCGDDRDNDCDGTVDEPNNLQPIVLNIVPVADASVDSSQPLTNYGSSQMLKVDGSPVKVAYLRFDVTGMIGKMESARLELHAVNASVSGGTIHAVSDTGWDENTITFNTAPFVDGPAIDTMGEIKTGDIIGFDVTRAISGNGIYDFAIDSDHGDGASYFARENPTHSPELMITLLKTEFPYYCDDDSDGYIDASKDGLFLRDGCLPAACREMPGDDCNDTDAAVNRAALEICDGRDNNCDDLLDDNDPGIIDQETWFADTDGDNHGEPNSTILACNQPVGYVPDYTDCNDNDPAVNPSAIEFCDGKDNTCNGLIDDSDPDITGRNTWFADMDGDGHGDPNSTILACNQPEGFISDNTDCNDGNKTINPGSTEICDGIDNDCDDLIDDNDPEIANQGTWYADTDGDSHGDPNSTILACSPPAGFVSDNSDCNDKDSFTFPGQTWYQDADGDGYSDGTQISQCARPAGYKAEIELTAISRDCDDGNNAIHPDVPDLCDALDNDCDPDTDDGSGESWYGAGCDGPDADLCAEGFYACINRTQYCSDVGGDTAEVCDDGRDNDCDGSVDEPDIWGPPLVIHVAPAADASVDSTGVLTPYGLRQILKVDGSPVKVTYLRFEVTGVKGKIESARLKLHAVNSSVSGGTIHAVSDTNWDENTITFHTAPVIDGPAIDIMGEVQTGDIVEFDLTDAVDGNGTYSFAVNSDHGDGASYFARENPTHSPELIITLLEKDLMYYCDDDSDGHIDTASGGIFSRDGCLPAGCRQAPGDDCNDSESLEFPGQIWYQDADGDGYSNGTPIIQCARPIGYNAVAELTTISGDCDDGDSAVHPGAPEIPDHIDNDCDGKVDEL